MLIRTFASAVTGIDAVTVTIEVNVSRGVRFFLVGLPDSAVKESQQRIESALRSMGYHWPGKQVVINMAPADIRKEGSSYDLPLAIGILSADEKVGIEKIDSFVLIGELSLDGTLAACKRCTSYSIKGQGRRLQRIAGTFEECTGRPQWLKAWMYMEWKSSLMLLIFSTVSGSLTL